MHELWTAPLTHGPASADDDDRTLYDIASAIIFYRAEQPDSAQYYIDRSLAHIKRFNQNNIGLYTIASAIHHRRGEDGKACACAMQYIGKRDSLDKARQGVSVAELEKRYRTANETALREAGLRYRIWIATLACLLLAAAVTGAVVGYRRKLRHRDAQLSEYLTLLESYRESHDSLTSRLDASNEREAAVKASLEGRFALLRDIAATYYTYGEGERLARKVKELALSPAMLADIVRMADLYNDRAVTRLRRQLPGWTPRNYDFAALVVAGFSAQEISVMLDMTLNGVYTLKIETQTPDRRIGGCGQGVFHPFFRIARAPGAPTRIRGIAPSVNQHFTHKQARIIPYRQAASGLNFAGKPNEKTKQSYETDISFTRMRPGAFFRETDLRANCAGEGGRPGAATVVGVAVVMLDTDSTYLAAAASDADGRFAIASEVRPYRLLFQHLAYEMQTLTSEHDEAGEVVLHEYTNALDAVVVEGEKPIVRVEEGRLAYDMEAVSKGKAVNNAYEALTQLRASANRTAG